MSDTTPPPRPPTTAAKLGNAAKAAGARALAWIEGHPGPMVGLAAGIIIGWVARSLF